MIWGEVKSPFEKPMLVKVSKSIFVLISKYKSHFLKINLCENIVWKLMWRFLKPNSTTAKG